ncbi:MAG TPA: adenylyltransferase/cytidyltransferase family protein, partial [Longimicrobiales bacterium]|nr:adenylyltransferase/cytidyltransferase family protein [Longimicrobiales bacterium]
MTSRAIDPALPPGLPPDDGGTVVTVGTFDGVHRGHWEVLQEIRARAEQTGRRSVLVTFHPHPLRIVRPEHAPPLLTTPVEKKEILAE